MKNKPFPRPAKSGEVLLGVLALFIREDGSVAIDLAMPKVLPIDDQKALLLDALRVVSFADLQRGVLQ